MLKDIGFIKFLIGLPEKQKTWAVLICCGTLLIIQTRYYEIREIDRAKSDEIKFEKMRSEKNMIIVGKDAIIQSLNDAKYEDMRDFKKLYFETERMKLKIRENDSIIQKKI